MAKERRVPLSAPIGAHGELVKEVVLREPRASDFFSLGDPFVWAQNADGSMFPVENSEAIRAYLDRCVVSPDPLLMGQIGLADAMAVKAAMLDFFVQARTTSTTPATSSSSS